MYGSRTLRCDPSKAQKDLQLSLSQATQDSRSGPCILLVIKGQVRERLLE